MKEEMEQCDEDFYNMLEKRDKEIERLRDWVNDLQAGMYINCVYCGHRYGPNTEIPTSMADVLKEHIEKCPEHPLFEARQEIERLKKEKEWLLKTLVFVYKDKMCESGLSIKAMEWVLKDMQQELKEKKKESIDKMVERVREDRGNTLQGEIE